MFPPRPSPLPAACMGLTLLAGCVTGRASPGRTRSSFPGDSIQVPRSTG